MAMNFLKLISHANDASSSSSSSSGYPSGASGGAYYDPAASTRGGPPKAKRVYTPQETDTMKQIAFLLAKMETLTLPEDRRATMDQLTQAVRDHPELPVDAPGLRTLMTLAKSIQQDRHATANIDTSLQAVECIKILLAPHDAGATNNAAGVNGAAAAGADDDSTGSSAAAAANAPLISLFVQNPHYITTLLELLEQKHSALRLLIIQCLSSLLRVRTEKLQSIVLNHPMGVIVLVELLSDPSEAIRNDTLLLLELLTRGAPAIQQIVAFNGGFEQLLAIARKDIEQDSGIIAEDALRIVSSLLSSNPVTQNIFLQDPACVAKLLPYLRFKEEDLREDASGADFEFLGLTLEILNHLVGCIDYSPTAPAQKNNNTRNALAQLVHPLLALAMSRPPVEMRLEVWTLLCQIIDGHTRNQSLLESYPLETHVLMPGRVTLQYEGYPHDEQRNPWVRGKQEWRTVRKNCLKYLLDLSCDSGDATERCILVHLIGCYFYANPDAQLRAMMSFAPSPTAMARGGVRQADLNQNGSLGGPSSSAGQAQSSSSGGGGPEEEAEETGPMLGPSLLAMLAGSRPQPADLLHPGGPEGSLYIDRARWTASKVIGAMLEGNADCQLMLLTLPLMDASAPGAPSASKLLDYYIASLFASQNHGSVEPSLLTLLCLWTDGCVELNEIIFTRYSTNLLAYLVQMARDDNVQEVSRGLATYYLALVLELMSNPPSTAGAGQKGGKPNAASPPLPFSSPSIPSSTLLSLITQSIGLDRFKSNLSGLERSPELQHARRRLEGKEGRRGEAPLGVWRKLEEEYPPPPSSSSSSDPSAAAQEDASRQATLIARLHSHLTFSNSFAQRFKTVQDKCDQRLLNLFTSASGAPSAAGAAASSSAQHSAQTNQNGVGSTHPHPDAHSLHSASTPPTLSSSSSFSSSAHPGSSLSSADSRELLSLREENARLKKEAEMFRGTGQPGAGGEVVRQLQAQVAQLQSENAALRSGAPASTNGLPSSDEFHKLRKAHAELLSEHEDLLILLASQEVELEEARSSRPPQRGGSDGHGLNGLHGVGGKGVSSVTPSTSASPREAYSSAASAQSFPSPAASTNALHSSVASSNGMGHAIAHLSAATSAPASAGYATPQHAAELDLR